MSGYDVNKSQVSDNARAEFLEAHLNHDLESIPGIGPATAKKLNEAGIESSFQLMGQFLFLATNQSTCKDVCDEMWYFLQERGVSAHRSGIVQCIAEKCETAFPTIFTASEKE